MAWKCSEVLFGEIPRDSDERGFRFSIFFGYVIFGQFEEVVSFYGCLVFAFLLVCEEFLLGFSLFCYFTWEGWKVNTDGDSEVI